MLVLSRKLDESVIIGDDFKVTVLSIKGNQIRLGIDAPKEVAVHRKEVHLRIKDAMENPPSDDLAINDPHSSEH